MRDAVRMECPQCAVKHLSAALAYYEQFVPCVTDETMPLMYTSAAPETYAARAAINLVEFAEGYTTHLPLAIGFLVAAEDVLTEQELSREIRAVRTQLQDALGSEKLPDVVRECVDKIRFLLFERARLDRHAFCGVFAEAHLAEAMRECSDIKPPADSDFAVWATRTIDWLVDEYWTQGKGRDDGDGETA